MRTYEWETARGAQVKIEVSQSHKAKNYLDGYEVEVERNEMRIEKFEVNGKEYRVEGIRYHQDEHKIVFAINGQMAGAAIPEEIYEDMMKETKERERKADEEMNEYYAMQATLDRYNKETY